MYSIEEIKEELIKHMPWLLEDKNIYNTLIQYGIHRFKDYELVL